MLESRAMFEVKLQTYWGDSDAVGIVFFPNYFKFVAQAEEELYRAAGILKDKLMDKHQIWLAARRSVREVYISNSKRCGHPRSLESFISW